MPSGTPSMSTLSMPAEEALAAQLAEPTPPAPAQGIQCGDLSLAFPYAWARAIVEDFSLTPIPNAPAWLVGAANVEGEIVPVFDLVSWAASDVPPQSPAEPGVGRARLLVGGHENDRAGILFSGSARMVRYAPDAPPMRGDTSLPARLRAVVLCASEATPPHWVVDAPRLFDTLAHELTL